MIRQFFENKKMNLKALADTVHRNYSTFLDHLDTDNVRVKDIAILHGKGIINRQDVDFLLGLLKE